MCALRARERDGKGRRATGIIKQAFMYVHVRGDSVVEIKTRLTNERGVL